MSTIAKKWGLLDSEAKSSYVQRANLAKHEYSKRKKQFEAGPLKDFLISLKSRPVSEKRYERSSESSSGSESSSSESSSSEGSSEDEDDSEAEEILRWKKKNG